MAVADDGDDLVLQFGCLVIVIMIVMFWFAIEWLVIVYDGGGGEGLVLFWPLVLAYRINFSEHV